MKNHASDAQKLPNDSNQPRNFWLSTIFQQPAKALIPSHYFLDGLTTDVSGLESADGWVNDQEKVHHADVRRLNTADLTLNAAELKGSRHRVYYFGNHFEKK